MQAAAPSTQAQSQPKPLVPQSATLDNKFIKQALSTNMLQQLDVLLKDGNTIKKLQQGVLYFKPPKQGDGSSRNALSDPNNPKRWGGVHELSPILREHLVFRLSEDLNLDEVQTFELLDGFFVSNEKARDSYRYLTSSNQRLDQINSQLNQNLALGPNQNPQLYYANIHKYKELAENEILKTIGEIKKMSYLYYFEERLALLDSIFSILNASLNIEKYNFVSQLNPNELVENLIKGFEATQKSLGSWEKFDQTLKREIVISLQKEEVLSLQCMFQIYRHHLVPQPTQMLRLFKYQSENGFNSYMMKQNTLVYLVSSDAYIKQQFEIINDFHILNAFNIMQVQVFSEEDMIKSQKAQKFVSQLFSNADGFTQLQDLMDKMNLDSLSAPVYLCFRQILQAIKAMDLISAFKLGPGKDTMIKMDLNRRINQVTSTYFLETVAGMSETQKYYSDEFKDRRGELQFTIQDWINLVYPFLKEHQPVQKVKAQTLTYEILKQLVHLKRVWNQIDLKKGQLLGEEAKVNERSRVIYHTIDIFEDILMEPLNDQNFNGFIQLMNCLCGKSNQGNYSIKLFELLRTYNLGQLTQEFLGHQDMDLIQFIIRQFQDYSLQVSENRLNDTQFLTFSNICLLISKFLSQNPILYEVINQELLLANLDGGTEADIQGFRLQRGNIDHPEDVVRAEPLIASLITSLHDLFNWNNLEEAIIPIKHLIRAIAVLYKELDLQSEILLLIESYYVANSYTLIDFFKFAVDNYECQLVSQLQPQLSQQKYRITEMVLKFLNAIFSQSFPQGYLRPENLRINLNHTFLGQALRQIYMPLLENFFSISFLDIKDMARFSIRLMKLTSILLSKYQDVNPLIRIPFVHRLPQFDAFLHILNHIFNNTLVENIVTNFILLSEELMHGIPTGVQNKFWAQCLKEGSGTTKNLQLIQKLVKNSLRVYDVILDLVHQNVVISTLSNDQLRQTNARSYYTQNLHMVQRITNFILNPGSGPTYQIKRVHEPEMSYSFFNIIQHYVNPGVSFCSRIKDLQTLALRFLVKCCRIWEINVQGRQRVSFESLLRATGLNFNIVKAQYNAYFRSCVTSDFGDIPSLEFLISFLDLLITSATSQQSFLEDIFKEQLFQTDLIQLLKINFHDGNNLLSNLQRIALGRALILISEISLNRLCPDFMKKLIEGDTLTSIRENVVKRFLPSIVERQLIDVNYLYPLTYQNKRLNQTQSIKYQAESYIKSLSFMVVKYYLRLLSDLYSVHIDNQNVRTAIASSFQQQEIQQIQLSLGSQTSEIFNALTELNRELVINKDLKTEHLTLEYIRQSSLQYQFTEEQVQFMESSKLHTEETYVQLLNLDGLSLSNQLDQCYYHDLLPSSFLYSHESIGSLGINFVINTEELLDVLQSYFFTNPEFLSRMRSLATQYNLLVSTLHGFSQLQQQIQAFVLSIGKTRTRENSRKKEFAQQDRVVNTSLFQLVDNRDISEVIGNNENVKAVQNKLTGVFIKIASSQCKQITDQFRIRQSAASDNVYADQKDMNLYLQSKIQEQNLDYLTVILGAINSLASIAPFTPDSIKQLEAVTDLIHHLASIRDQQKQLLYAKDIPQKDKVDKFNSASKLFMSIVLQTFSICLMIQNHKKEELKEACFPNDVQRDMDLVSTLSQVVQIMNDEYCFKEGLQILELGLQLVSVENIMVFLRRSDSPLRIIIKRIHSTSTNIEEGIQLMQFMIALARVEECTQLIVQENIAYSLSTSSLLQRVNMEDLYLETQDGKRNPSHIIWCYFLLFLRTLNSQFGNDPDYKPVISQQMIALEARTLSILNYTVDKNYLKQTLSLALLEEMDLMTGVIQQIFNYSSQFDQQDFRIFNQIKSSYLFSVINMFQLEDKIRPVSATERYLNNIEFDKLKENLGGQLGTNYATFTGFDLLCLMEKARVFLNMNSALLNALLVDKQQGNDIIGNIDRRGCSNLNTPMRRDYDMLSQAESYLTHDSVRLYPLSTTEHSSLSQLGSALYNFLLSLKQMNNIFKLWVRQEQHLANLFRDTYGLFKNDEWITQEYQSLNHYLGGATFAEATEEFESGMQMAYLVLGLLIEKLAFVQKYEESALGVRATTTAKQVMDYADNAKRLYSEFFSNAKESKLIKLVQLDRQIFKL